MYRIDFSSLQRRFSQVVFGHGRQLLGLAVHPEEEIFATAGCDKNIALWRKQKLLWTCHSGYECVSLAFHPFGAALAVGSTEGHLLVLNAENGSTMITLRVCGSPLNCISYNQGANSKCTLILMRGPDDSFLVFLFHSSWRYDCIGLTKWMHLFVPCVTRWILL